MAWDDHGQPSYPLKSRGCVNARRGCPFAKAWISFQAAQWQPSRTLTPWLAYTGRVQWRESKYGHHNRTKFCTVNKSQKNNNTSYLVRSFIIKSSKLTAYVHSPSGSFCHSQWVHTLDFILKLLSLTGISIPAWWEQGFFHLAF